MGKRGKKEEKDEGNMRRRQHNVSCVGLSRCWKTPISIILKKTSEQVPIYVANDFNVLTHIFECEAAFQWRFDGENDDGDR